MGPVRGPSYAELSCQSAFSFLRGASEPETLVQRAAELGYAGLALTDRDGLYGAPRFHRAAEDARLRAVHGTTLTLAGLTWADSHAGGVVCDGSSRTADDRVTLLAMDDGGWSSLCRLVSAARHGDRAAPCTPLARLAEHAGGLLAIAGPDLPEGTVATLREIFGPERLSLALHDRLLKRDRRGQALQRERGARLGLPLVVTGGVRFARREDKPAHDVLTCVRHKVTLEEAGTRLLPNAEFCLRPIEELARLFRHCPGALSRTVELAERCSFSLGTLAYKFPPCAVPPGQTPISQLRHLVQQGARQRYQPLRAAAAQQIARELALIEQLDLAGYFLLVHEIVRFCETHDILCQGRGSAANSAVCYVLGITSVDAVGMGMLFERFLSEDRNEMPDIDLDIEHNRREEVLQFVYARWGRDRAALAAEVVTWHARSAVRDAGKALGFTPAEVDVLAKGLDRRHDGDSGEVPAAWADRRDDPRLPHLLRLVHALSGLPRHLSIHVGGMIITGPPLTDVMPVEPAAMPGRTVVPWDKDDLAALRILKIDLLGLGMLTVLHKSFDLVNRTAGPGAGALSLHTVPVDDAPTWAMLQRADTVGVFQVESRAQMNCLPRLKPKCFYDLVIEVAIIRPGPIQGGMVHPFLRRRNGREPVTYPHPSLQPILERTLGVPLFQEQGMRIAMTAAGFSGSEADELRRAMGHKRSHERMAAISRRLVDGMARHGIPRAAAEQIYHQLEGFADFGFPESHAASFARLAWASAWLKQHHPAHFLCALLNSQPMGFYAPAVLVSDARRHGVTVLPVDVLQSDWESTLQFVEAPAAPVRGAQRTRGADAPDTANEGVESRSSASAGDVARRESARGAARYVARSAARTAGPVLGVRLGLCTVRGFGARHEAAVRAGLLSVAERGPFVSPKDFARRCGLDQALMEHLARLGALEGFEARRRHALWHVAQMARRVPGPLAEPLLPEADVRLPPLPEAEAMRENYRMGGISVDRHPLEFLRPRLQAAGVLTASTLARGGAPRQVAVAGMAICRQRPPTAHGLTFVTIEDETGFANLIVEPAVAERDRAGLLAGLLLAVGRVEHADGVTNLKVTRLQSLDHDTPVHGAPVHGAPIEGVPSHDYR